jgi:hypothetical protein
LAPSGTRAMHAQAAARNQDALRELAPGLGLPFGRTNCPLEEGLTGIPFRRPSRHRVSVSPKGVAVFKPAATAPSCRRGPMKRPLPNPASQGQLSPSIDGFAG